MKTKSNIQLYPHVYSIPYKSLTQSRHQKALEVVFDSFIWQDVIIRTAFTIRAHRVENLG